MIELLERRAERGEVRGAEATWSSAAERSIDGGTRRWRPTYHVVLAACVVATLGVAIGAASDRGDAPGATLVDVAAPATGEPIEPLPHEPVVLAGMEMIEAYRFGPAADEAAPSVWEVYVHPDGAASGVAMVSTTSAGGLDIRSHGIDVADLAAAAEFRDDAWVLKPASGLRGPVDRFVLGGLSASMPTQEEFHYTFIDDTFDEGSVAVSSESLWEPLHAMLSGARPPQLRPVEVLGVEGLGIETAFDMSIVLWSDDERTYIAQSPAHQQLANESPIPYLTVDELLDRIELADPERWRGEVAAAEAFGEGDGHWTTRFIVLSMVVIFFGGLLLMFAVAAKLLRRSDETT